MADDCSDTFPVAVHASGVQMNAGQAEPQEGNLWVASGTGRHHIQYVKMSVFCSQHVQAVLILLYSVLFYSIGVLSSSFVE